MSTDDQDNTVYIDEDLADLIPGFLENRRKDILEMTEALNQVDFECIQSIGHKMKGAGGGYGFDAITDYGRRLEDAARDADVDKIQMAVAGLKGYLDTVNIIYEE